MRGVVSLACVLAIAPAASAAAAVSVGHSAWSWGNPQPQGNDLAALSFAGGVGYAAGDFGTLLKTTDSGVTWTGLASGTTARFTQVRAVDADVIVASGGCVMRRSDDGGLTFRRLALPRCRTSITSLSFPDGRNGYVLLSDGSVLRTADGGATFAAATPVPGTASAGGSPPARPADVFFTGPATGVAAAGGALYRTTDSGKTWTRTHSGPALLNALYLDASAGYASGDDRTVLKTTNAGKSWTPLDLSALPAVNLTRVACAAASPNRCLFTRSDGRGLIRTGNGGASFTAVNTAIEPAAAAFNSQQSAVAVGGAGDMALSADGAVDWAPVGTALSAALTRLRVTPGGVFATGQHGALLRTTNGGEDWTTADLAVSADVADAGFPSATVGYALDSTGHVHKTTDGGAHWRELPADLPGTQRALFAPTAGTVLLIGPRLARSRDGGATFTTVPGGRGMGRSSISDYDRAGATLFLYGQRALFSAAVDGGGPRRVRRPGARAARLRTVDFVTARLGYALNADGRLWKTRDGGRHWSALRAARARGLVAMAWHDARNGYLVARRYGAGPAHGYVLRTADGGRSWRAQLVAEKPLRSIVAPAGSSALATGARGQLFFTDRHGRQGGRPSSGAGGARPVRRAT
jgi:photosystem II stability/assembly factor-like uncharacterized protein